VAFLDTLQRRTFDFFWERTPASNGLTPDRWPTPSFSSIAAVGFALTAYPVGVEHGWITRAQAAAAAAGPAADGSPTASDQEMSDLAIRLLDGDERRLVRAIVEAKGTILQRDLVRITSFSDAKVSRLLDRLEGRGLVIRERHGMTNRVRLTLRET